MLSVIGAFVPATIEAQTTGQTQQTEGAIAVGDATISDSQIRARIAGLLDELDAYQDVLVFVSDGVVTLNGAVSDSTVRQDLGGIVNRVSGVVAIKNQTEIGGSIEDRLTPAAERLEGRVRDLAASAPIFLVALATFALIAALGWMLTTRLRIWHRFAPNGFIAEIYKTLARVAFITLGLVVALDILNATALLGAVLGAAGVAGLALGFAVRDTVENFIASVLLSLRQPFQPNDLVEIGGDIGNVARLTARATILISPDGNQIRIPNATVFKGRIVNYSRDANRRFSFTLGVDADSDLASALSTAVSALEGLPFTLTQPPVAAWIEEVGDSNVVLYFAAWVDQTDTDFSKARGEAIRTAKTALETAGFGLPEPIYRLRIQGKGAEQTFASPQPETPKTPPAQPLGVLPKAANPELLSDEAEQAVARERRVEGSEPDLLDNKQQSE